MNTKDISLEDCEYLGHFGTFTNDPSTLKGPKKVYHFDPKGHMGYAQRFGERVDIADLSDEQFAALVKGYQDAWEFQAERRRVFLERKAVKEWKQCSV